MKLTCQGDKEVRTKLIRKGHSWGGSRHKTLSSLQLSFYVDLCLPPLPPHTTGPPTGVETLACSEIPPQAGPPTETTGVPDQPITAEDRSHGVGPESWVPVG